MVELLRRLFRADPVVQTAWNCGVYFDAHSVTVYSESRTANGIGWGSRPVWSCPRSGKTSELGKCVREALNSSVGNYPEDDSQLKKHPILDHAKAKSWRDLEKRFSFISVESDRNAVNFICLRRPNKKSEGTGRYVIMEGDDTPKASCDWSDDDETMGGTLLSVMESFELGSL